MPENLLDNLEMLGMGHGERVADANLGLGHVYYALVRVVRPTQVVVIGSYRGFVPILMAQGAADNLESAQVDFIDPALVDGFWRDPVAVKAHFARYTPQTIRHHLLTTEQFVKTAAYAAMHDVGLLFIDGYHSYAQAKFDFESFVPRLADNALVLFHDSVRVRWSRIYGEDKAFEHRVKDFIDELKTDARWQVFDLPFGDGVTLVRRSQ